MMADDPPFLSVGTEVSAKYKGAFCEAKIRKVVKCVKCKVLFKQGLGMTSVPDDAVKGIIRVGSVVEARHPEKKEFIEGTITKIQDCSQYTVVFDDGDITTLRRTALCLKSGRHFAESETLDQLPLTHPEHFGNPVIGGRRGRRRGADSSDEEEVTVKTKPPREEKEADIGRVVCVEGDKKKQRDNWFPGLVVAPTAQDTVRIHVRDEYLVRSFKDGRYYTVPKKETTEFTREAGAKVDNHSVKAAVEKALLFLDKDELPPHWDRDSLFGLNEPSNYESDHDSDSDNPDDEPREEKDHFVAQLYKFMDDRGTPINQGPTICSRDVDLYRLFYVVHNLGGYNRVTNHNHWKIVSRKLGYGQSPVNVNLVKHVYKKFLHSFEEFYRKLGCTMVSNPRTYRNRGRTSRSLIRDKDRLSIKAESKERSDADESEEASVAGSLGTLQDVQDIKIEVEDPPVEPAPTKIKVEPKEEPEKKQEQQEKTKKTVEKEKITPKCKEEKKKIKEEDEKEEDVKIKIEPVKEKPRIRQSKIKPNETVIPTLKKSEKEVKKEVEEKEEIQEVVVEKKKRLFTRGFMKEKEKIVVTKPSITCPGLVVTRQKRAIKDRVKAFVDRFKFRLTKETPPVSTENSDKNQNTNKEKIIKVKEEPVVTPNVVKKKEEPVKEEVKVLPEEKKKVGRKKKEKKEQDEANDSPPTYKSVCVGDKLKVYYGPTNESKVTYEAKVLSVKNDGPEVMYLVHYTGWNNRYDEYIKHSRIADNLSWVPGRSSKKNTLSFLKPGRRKNSISKPEGSIMKPEFSGSNRTENKGEGLGPGNKADSPGASTKSSSPVESNSQNKPVKSVAVTRSSSRNSKKEETVTDNDHDEEPACPMPSLYMSDELLSEKTQSEKVKEILGINDESSLVSAPEKRKAKKRNGGDDSAKNTDVKPEPKGNDDSTGRDESCPSPKIDRRKKRSQSESENIDSKEKKRQYTRRRRSSSTTEDKSDSVSVELESPGSGDDRKRTRKRSSGLEYLESNSPQKKRRLLSEKKPDTSQVESNSQQSLSTDEESNQKIADQETEEASKGRDFDLIQIRSELKGLDKAVKAENESYKSLSSDNKAASDKKTETEKLAEDIYEFKEPEPFEFEVRKSSDDKGKSLQRRPLGRLFEDSKKSHAVLLSNMFYKEKKDTKPEEPKKSFLNSIYIFEDESFDKVTSSPRRPLTEESSTSKPFQLFSDLPDEEPEQDSIEPSNPLNVTDMLSKNEVLDSTFSKLEETSSTHSASPKSNFHPDIEFNENSNMDSNEVESTSKSCFSRDDDDDEMEDESINFAIQRAIKQDLSDDDDTNPSGLISVQSSIFPTELDKIPDKPVIVESVNVHESDDLDSCPILDKNEELEDKCEERSSDGMESDAESDTILADEDKEDEKEESMKDEEDAEEEEEAEEEDESVTTLLESSVVVSSAVVADNVVIAGEELVSTSSIITPIVMSADMKEGTIELSADLNEEDQVAKTIFTVSTSPSANKSSDDPFIEPIAATVQVVTNDSDLSDSEKESSPKELREERIKIEPECEFSFKPITVPPPDESESSITMPYTENKSTDEIIINLEPLKHERETGQCDKDDIGRVDLNLDSLLCEETIPGSPGCGDDNEEKIEAAPLLEMESKIERIEEVMGQPIAEEIVSTEEPPPTIAEISPGSSPTDSPPVDSTSVSPPPISSYLPTAENHFTEQKDSDDDSKLDKTPTKQETLRRASSALKRPKPGKKRHTETVKRRHYRSRQTGSDSDDTSENSTSANIGYNRSGMPSSTLEKDTSNNDNTKSLSKYNFLVNLDPSMDQNTRINLIQNSIQHIRKVYAELKSELAVIDRRRKKLRKRERENLAASRIH